MTTRRTGDIIRGPEEPREHGPETYWISLAIKAGLAVIGLIILWVVLENTLYAVDEREWAIELRFGELKNVREEPGLYMKMPFVDSIQRIDKRTLRADIPPREVPDKDKERLIIDMIVRYQISDPVQFRKTLRNESTALERLQNIVYSALRDTIAESDRTEVIGAQPLVNDAGNPLNNEEGLPIYASLSETRERISKEIQERISHAVTEQGYGLEIISTNIKRADFPPQVTAAIFARLKSERQRVAARHRANGEEEYRKRTAAVQAQADILIAEAQRDARAIRGEGDAQAVNIIQAALQKDPEFYDFLRTLESYETSVQPGATLIITDEGYMDKLFGKESFADLK